MARRQRLASALSLLILTVAASAEGFIRVDEDEYSKSSTPSAAATTRSAPSLEKA